jgi:hypothetical protein
MLLSIPLLLLAAMEDRPPPEDSLTFTINAHTEFGDSLLSQIDLVLLVK